MNNLPDSRDQRQLYQLTTMMELIENKSDISPLERRTLAHWKKKLKNIYNRIKFMAN